MYPVDKPQLRRAQMIGVCTHLLLLIVHGFLDVLITSTTYNQDSCVRNTSTITIKYSQGLSKTSHDRNKPKEQKAASMNLQPLARPRSLGMTGNIKSDEIHRSQKDELAHNPS